MLRRYFRYRSDLRKARNQQLFEQKLLLIAAQHEMGRITDQEFDGWIRHYRAKQAANRLS